MITVHQRQRRTDGRPTTRNDSKLLSILLVFLLQKRKDIKNKLRAKNTTQTTVRVKQISSENLP